MESSPTKPERLRPGDTVAVLSPSWGGPSVFPHIYDLGVRNLEALLGVRVRAYPTALMANEELYANPERRADDLSAAFADPEVKAIFATIGGDDSVRTLPYLDLPRILANPKILMGYSDTTTLTSYLSSNGMVTFNGPSIMAGFAQLRHQPAGFGEHVRHVLMEPERPVIYEPFTHWSDGYCEWQTPGYDGELGELRPNGDAWRWLQGEAPATGRLFGGCIEVLEFLKGTEFWPPLKFFSDKILFFETSEDKPPVNQVMYFLRNYGSMGVLERISAILFGRARSYSDEEKDALYEMIRRVIGFEFGRTDIPIVANLDFGHTDPQWIIPQGVLAEVDPDARHIRLLESAVR